MKIKQQILKRTPLLMPTLFYTGVVASGYLLLLTSRESPSENFKWASILVGVTFFFGAIAITLLASIKTERVVYLERSRKEANSDQTSEDVKGMLRIGAIEEIIEGPYDSLQNALNEICNQLQAGQGAIYLEADHEFELKYGYALPYEEAPIKYKVGEGLVGRVASDKSLLYIDKLPDDYMTIFSGLGSSSPSFLVLVPMAEGTKVKGVLEISTFQPMDKATLQQLNAIAEQLTKVLHKEKMVDYA